MDEKKSFKVGLGTTVCVFIIILLIVALGVVYYLGFIESKNDLYNLKAEKITLETKISELENKISLLQTNNEEKSTSSQISENSKNETAISLPLGKFIGTGMKDDVNLEETVYGGADNFAVILKKNNMCEIDNGYGFCSLGVYKIENDKLICNTIIERGEEGPLTYKETNTIYEYSIIDKNTIKLVNLSGEKSDPDIYSRKIGRIFKLSNAN